uniref:(northern house mosquito) hypothetical protein n=1 Tax=Culex pipiens TaxID=7175 RepID=A0A8D8H3T1_CULPI
MSSRQLSNYTLDRLEASLSRFYLQENSSTTAVTYGSSGSSKGNHYHHHGFKLVATETKVVQETTHRELVLEGSYGDSQDSDVDDSGDAAGEQSSYDDDPTEQVGYEAPSGGMVGYAVASHQYAEKEYYREEQESSEQYEESSGYDGGYDGGYELDSYGGQSDYDGYYSQDGYGDYY